MQLDSRLSGREVRRNTLILAACFASALAVMFLPFVVTVADKVLGAHTVVQIMNRTDATIRKIRLEGPGCSAAIGDLPPGATRQVKLYAAGDGVVDMRFVDAQGSEVRATVSGYVTHNLPVRSNVVIDADGTVKWEDAARERQRSPSGGRCPSTQRAH